MERKFHQRVGKKQEDMNIKNMTQAEKEKWVKEQKEKKMKNFTDLRQSEKLAKIEK